MMLNSVVQFGQSDPEVTRRYETNQKQLTAAFRHALTGAIKRGSCPLRRTPARLPSSW